MRATRPDIVRMRQPAVVSFVAHSGMVRVPGSNGNSSPLTLTLSPREREQPAAGSVVREVRQADTELGCAEGRGGFSLSPREGRGEGKGDARCANRVGSSSSLLVARRAVWL